LIHFAKRCVVACTAHGGSMSRHRALPRMRNQYFPLTENSDLSRPGFVAACLWECYGVVVNINLCRFSTEHRIKLARFDKSSLFFHPEYEVTDESGLVIFRITGPVCKLECFGLLEFPVREPDGKQVAGIVTGDRITCCGHIYEKDNYRVMFPAEMPVKHKALLTSAAILFDYNYLANANPIRWG